MYRVPTRTPKAGGMPGCGDTVLRGIDSFAHPSIQFRPTQVLDTAEWAGYTHTCCEQTERPSRRITVGTGRAEIAQLVEHATENRGVRSSNLRLGTTRKWLSGRASPCQGEGRRFESRSSAPGFVKPRIRPGLHSSRSRRRGQVVKAGVCKTPIVGSIPTVASGKGLAPARPFVLPSLNPTTSSVVGSSGMEHTMRPPGRDPQRTVPAQGQR